MTLRVPIILLCMIINLLQLSAKSPLYHFSFDDESFANTGSAINNETPTPEGMSFVPGAVGKAIEFNNRSISLPFDSAKLLNKGEYSISFWVNAEENKGTLVDQNGGTGICLDWYSYGLRIRTDRRVNHCTGGIPKASEWIHVTYSYNRETGGTCYYNAEPVYTNDGNGTGWFKNGALKLGPFKGKLDEVKIFDRALSQEEVYEVSGLEAPPSEQSSLAINLVLPQQTQEYTEKDSIELEAQIDLHDPTIKIKRVVYYSGTQWLGQSKEAPYNINWEHASPGLQYIRAKVWDSKGVVSFSEPRIINVKYAMTETKPVAVAGSTRINWIRAAEPLSIKLEGRVFSSSLLKNINCEWRLTQGPESAIIKNPSQFHTEVIFKQPAIYSFELRATDLFGTSTSLTHVTIHPESKDYGYDVDYLKDTFTIDYGFQYNFEGLAMNRFKKPPKAYVHPRIFFNPEDVPNLRNRLKNTQIGQYVIGRIRQRLDDQLRSNEFYNSPETDSDECRKWLMSSATKAFMAYESLLILIDDDKEQGAKAARVFAASAKETYKQLKARMPTTNYREDFQGIIARQFMGINYDFLYNYMTKNQQDTARKMLSLATSNMWSIGMDALPSSSGSNWVPTHIMHLMFCALAIEGEDGYDPKLYPRLVTGYENYLNTGVFPDGSTMEGLGKNTIIAEVLLPMAKRGNYLIASNQIRNHIEKFYTYSMVPSGTYKDAHSQQFKANIFTWDETLGGCYNASLYVDLPVVKYAFPNNKIIDTVNRFELQDNFERLFDFNIRFPYKAMDYMFRAICAEDWDRSLTPEQSKAQLENLPLTYYANFRGRLMTHSDWSSDAMQVHFQPRNTSGGHTQRDRNKFIISALGRVWGGDSGPHGGTSKGHSVITINGKEPSSHAAKMMKVKDHELATFGCGDARAPYSHFVKGDGVGTPIRWNINMNYRQKRFEPWTDKPSSNSPHWNNSRKVSRSSLTFMNKPNAAYRTVGLVRGEKPYTLVIDNINLDDQKHNYEWLFYLGANLGNGITFNGEKIDTTNDWTITKIPSSKRDIILSDPKRPINMLVRILNADGFNNIKAPDKGRRLKLTAQSKSPGFVVLLYPFRDGEELPKSHFTGLNGSLKIKIGEQLDSYKLQTLPKRRTQLIMQRNGSNILTF